MLSQQDKIGQAQPASAAGLGAGSSVVVEAAELTPENLAQFSKALRNSKRDARLAGLVPEQEEHRKSTLNLKTDTRPRPTKEAAAAAVKAYKSLTPDSPGVFPFESSTPLPADELFQGPGFLRNSLMEACERRDLVAVNNYLDSPALLEKIDDADLLGHTPLVIAIKAGHANIVHALLEAGANCNITDGQWRGPLIHAVLGGHFDIIQLLLAGDVQVNAQDEKAYSALMYAVLLLQPKAASRLLHAGADRLQVDRWGHTAYDLALSQLHKVKDPAQNREWADFLSCLDPKKDPRIEEIMATFPPASTDEALALQSRAVDDAIKRIRLGFLVEEIKSGAFGVTKGKKSKVTAGLLFAGVDVNARFSWEGSPLSALGLAMLLPPPELYSAWSYNSNLHVFAQLVRGAMSLNADIRIPDDYPDVEKRGLTPLHFLFSFMRHQQVANVATTLLKRGADINALDAQGVNPLLLLLRNLFQKDVLMQTYGFIFGYYRGGAYVPPRGDSFSGYVVHLYLDPADPSQLLYDVQEEDTEDGVILEGQALLERDLPLGIFQEIRSALSSRSDSRLTDTQKFAVLTATTLKGHTLSGYESLIQDLLIRGADPSHKDLHGESALKLVLEGCGLHAILVDPSVRSTPLLYAISEQDEAAVLQLIKKNASLALAAALSAPELTFTQVLGLIQEHAAEEPALAVFVNQTNLKGVSPLMLAVRRGYSREDGSIVDRSPYDALIKLLLAAGANPYQADPEGKTPYQLMPLGSVARLACNAKLGLEEVVSKHPFAFWKSPIVTVRQLGAEDVVPGSTTSSATARGEGYSVATPLKSNEAGRRSPPYGATDEAESDPLRRPLLEASPPAPPGNK